MDSNPSSIDALDSDAWGIIERQLLKFENAWQEQSVGQKASQSPRRAEPDIRQFLTTSSNSSDAPGGGESDSGVSPSSPRLRLLAELIKIDLEYRWKKGIERRAEDYFAAHPELETKLIQNEIVEAELEARRIARQLPAESELKNRFGAESNVWLAYVNDRSYDSSLPSGSRNDSRGAMDTVVGDSVGSTVGKSLSEIGDLKVGHRIDRYVLRDRIGHGAFSVVWRARDTHLKRDIAIKILRPDKIEHDESLVVRLMREGRAAAAIDHPGVVKIHEVSSQDDCTFIVEQLIDGPNLKKTIEQEIPTTRRAAEIIRDVSRAVHAAHECGVIHRDIKPANILLAGGDKPMLVDFGLACLDQFADATLTKQGELLGTPAYMSPQQAQGQHHLVDARSDVYSLGAVLYHLLTGQLPFGGTTLTMLDAVVYKLPSRSALARHSIDRDLETIVLKCLEKDPADRYQSAEEFSDDLRRHLDGEPILARPVGTMEKTWKWSKRHPRWAGMLIATFLLVAFLGGTLIQLSAVSAQRTRAEAAENRSQQLLLESEKTAGRLAMQRGKMAEAVDHFRQAESLNLSVDQSLKLDLIESLIAIRQIDEAKSELGQVLVDALPVELRAQGRLLEAQLELETGDPFKAEQLFASAAKEPLSMNRAAYVRAMLAERSPDAVDELKKSLEIAPLSHHPRRMLVTLLLSLAEFDEAEIQLGIAKQLFPDDVDFQLLESIALTVDDQLEEAQSQIDGLALSEQQKNDWKEFCSRVHEFRFVYTHRQEEFGFDESSLSRLSQVYMDVASPCLSARGFVFPPKIAVRFTDLLGRLEEFYAGNIDTKQTWPELTKVVEIHPEGSLIVLELSTLLNPDKIAEAFERCKTLESANGFVSDSNETFAQIQFTAALIQFTKSDPSSDRSDFLRSGTEAIIKFEKYPYLVDKFSQNADFCRMLNTLLIESFKVKIADEELVQKWLARLKDNPESDRNETIWLEAVVANRASRPFDALHLLEELVANSKTTNKPIKADTVSAAVAMQKFLIQRLKANLKKGESLQISETDKPDSATSDKND